MYERTIFLLTVLSKERSISPPTLWVRIPLRRGVLDTTLATGFWFSPGIPLSSTNKTDRHNIADILLKVASSTIIITFHPLIQGADLSEIEITRFGCTLKSKIHAWPNDHKTFEGNLNTRTLKLTNHNIIFIWFSVLVACYVSTSTNSC